MPVVDGIATVEGFVATVDGEPLADVLVAVDGAQTVTNSDGHFILDTPADDGATIVVALQKQGWVRGLERLDARDGAINVVRAVMMAEAAAVPLDASAGGQVTGLRNAAIVAPPGAFVHADGRPVDGLVDVHLTPLNPAVAEEYDAYPGDGLARDASGTLIQLETFGVIDVTVRQDGETLDIADGMGVEVQIPLPDPAPLDPPPTMPLWSFEDESGQWVEEGLLTLDAQAGVYRGTLPHLSPWNADQPLSATCVRGKVDDPQGRPVAGAMVFAQGVDYLGGSTAVTDSDGEFCVAVRKSSTVEVTAYALDGSTTRIVESGITDTEVPPQCDADCLDTGEWTIVPGEGDSNWGGGTCTPPDVDTHVALDFDSLGFTLDLSAADDAVACGFQIDDPAAGPDEPVGTTYLTWTQDDGLSAWVIVYRGSDEQGSFEGAVVAQPQAADSETEPTVTLAASCILQIDEADEVSDDVFVVGGNGSCQGYRSDATGYQSGTGTVDFRGVAGLFNGIVPLICCDAQMLPPTFE